MQPDASVEVLEGRATRRAVVRSGARLAYAAPVVAATMALLPAGAGAACACAFGTVEVTRRANPNRGRCAVCPPGYRYRAGEGDCRLRQSFKPATYQDKVCTHLSGT